MTYNLKINCLKFSSTAILMLLFQLASAQYNLQDLEVVYNERQKTLKTDVVLMVTSKDTVIYQKDTKLFNAARGQAPIGTSSQWLTAAMVMLMVDEGKISLDDKVSKYLPYFEKYGKGYITIRHCLSHNTGIENKKKRKKFETLDEEALSFAANEIETNAGTQFNYSEIGFIIAARVLEVVSKKKFDMLIQQKLFRPLGMRQTSFSTMDGSLVNPSNGARSTAADYIKFLRMLLNNGKHNGNKILSESAVAELRKIHGTMGSIKNPPDNVEGFDYGLGAWAAEQNGTEATVLLEPSNGGTLPYIDFCRGYAFILFVKEQADESKMATYLQVKNIMDQKIIKKCN